MPILGTRARSQMLPSALSATGQDCERCAFCTAMLRFSPIMLGSTTANASVLRLDVLAWRQSISEAAMQHSMEADPGSHSVPTYISQGAALQRL